MLLRRTAPLPGLAVATLFNVFDVVLGPSIATAMIYGDALYAASLYGRRRTSEWLLGTTLAASVSVAILAQETAASGFSGPVPHDGSSGAG
ncbi:hypothetical protein [Actinomadura sp. 3N407]|uniref:hypothetical protein n=1 Tax=Actinomadura sp. 3N407 TaxID=3457423 RepID=UPI003FCD4AF7